MMSLDLTHRVLKSPLTCKDIAFPIGGGGVRERTSSRRGHLERQDAVLHEQRAANSGQEGLTIQYRIPNHA